uniref:Uncharacterized protein n=1 Tax=candidate division WOR-3 bacterium TaxID=2052148 RepID=A0A7C3N9P3_UNCW3
MRYLQILFFTFLINLNLFPEKISYIIFKDDKIVGYSSFEIKDFVILERTIFLDGFSKEYIFSKTDVKENYFKSYRYYADKNFPDFIEFKDGILVKKIGQKIFKYKIKLNKIFGIENILTVSYLGGISEDSIFNFDRNEILKVKKDGEKFSFGFGDYSIFRSKGIIDSVFYLKYKYLKSGNNFEINNPYYLDLNYFYQPKDFFKKKNRKNIELKYTKIQISYNDENKEVLLITPFTFTSDMFGNISNLVTPFTQLQLSENLNIPTLIFEFKTKDVNPVTVKEGIKEIYEFLKKNYQKVNLLTFNHLFLFCDIEKFDKVLLINPPLEDMNLWSEDFFKKLSVEKRYLFNNYEKFLKFEVVDTTIKENEIRNFYDKKENLIFIFSKDILSKSEIEKACKLKGKIYFVKNIDRRLNSYYKYDLWSFENNVFIDQKILNFLDELLNTKKE